MFKRLLVILFSFGVGLTFIAQAQQDQPITQPTVDAAVSTLIAQTQQAPAHLGATQTIQAALGQALTATAQSQVTPQATPAAFDAATLKLTGTTNIDLPAAPAGTGAYLAPDGLHFAYISSGGKTLCIYQGQTQGNCVDLSQTGGVETETVRWSPDSRYLVFTQDFFLRFRDPDIWVWDTVSNTLNDLTKTPTRVNTLSPTWTGVDVVPRWLPDGRIVFLRYSRQSGTILPPDIYVIAPDGSGLQKLGTLAVSDQFAVTALDVTATQLIYNYDSQSGSTSDGVWISDLDGKNARQLIQLSHDTAIGGVQMSPDGRFVLINTEQISLSVILTPESSHMSVIEVASGKSILIDPDHYVSAAGWSPQGSALVYVTHDVTQPDSDAVFLANTPGTAGQQLSGLQGRFNLPTPRLGQTLMWGANNTILLSQLPAIGIVLVQLGS